MLKKTILATVTGAAVLASGATFADNGRHYGQYRHGHRDVVVKHVYKPAPRPVYVQRHYYRPAPVVVHRPVYVERHVVVQRPAPVVHYSNDAGLAILAGAVIGGAIAYGIANH